MRDDQRIRMKRILCPTDFSEGARRALDHAALLARWYESELMVLHVLPRLPMLYGGFAPVEQSLALAPEVQRWAREELDRFTAPLRVSGTRFEAVLDEGDAAPVILRRAREAKADLIVVATHGRTGFDRWVLGSVTEKVLRKAACPVLTIPPSQEGSVPGRAVFRSILCPIDFSASAARALDFALSLAQEGDARLTLLHVVDAPAADEIRERGPSTAVDHLARMETEAEARLKASIPEEMRNWCRPEQRVVSGKPWREIRRVAGEVNADLIVMGVQGRSPLDLMMFGSTTHHVVREGGCPVLTVRAS